MGLVRPRGRLRSPSLSCPYKRAAPLSLLPASSQFVDPTTGWLSLWQVFCSKPCERLVSICRDLTGIRRFLGFGIGLLPDSKLRFATAASTCVAALTPSATSAPLLQVPPAAATCGHHFIIICNGSSGTSIERAHTRRFERNCRLNGLVMRNYHHHVHR